MAHNMQQPHTQLSRGDGGYLVGTFFQKNAHKTQENLISGMSDVLVSEKVDIYVTNSRYKNVQTIYDYFKNLPSTWLCQTCQLTPTMGLVGTWYGVSWIMNVKHMDGSSNSHSPVLILIQLI